MVFFMVQMLQPYSSFFKSITMQFIYSLTVTIYKVLTLPNFGWKKKEKYLPAENVLQNRLKQHD
jgi:hypothetical protein